MEIIINTCIFCVILFLYLHIQFHLKTSEDLEMYEIDQPSKERLEDICNLRQPVIFDFECQKIMDTSNKTYILDHYYAFEMKIRNTSNPNDDVLYIPLPVHSSMKLFEEDKTSSYISEHNQDLLDETGIGKNMKYNDEFLRPYMVSDCKYDVLMGSNHTYTPFQYALNYRNYFLLTQGSAKIKLAPPHSIKYLYPKYDYENYEFRSPVNPWSPQPKYVADFDKIKCLEITLTPGKTLFIPAYWWYSIQFNDSNTSISCFYYKTYMSTLATLPYTCMYLLQIQNVKRNVVKQATTNINNNNNNININTINNNDNNNNIIINNNIDNTNNNINNNNNTNNNDTINNINNIS